MPAHILVVEDEPAIQELIALNLEQAGQRAVMADSAEPSLRAAARAAGAVDCFAKPLRVEHLSPWLSPPAFDGLREAVAEIDGVA